MENFNELPPVEKARVLREQAAAARRAGQEEQAKGLMTQSLNLCRGHGDQQGIADSLVVLADLALHTVSGDEDPFTLRRRLSEEALGIYREIADRLGIARAARVLATVTPGVAAAALLEEALTLSRAEGDVTEIARSLDRLAAHLALSHPDQARAYRAEALDLSRQAGDRSGHAGTLFAEAVSHMANDLPEARRCAQEALAIYRELGARKRVAQCLMFMPMLGTDEEQTKLYLLEAREVCREIGIPLWEASCLRKLAHLAEECGDGVRAAALRSEAEHVSPEQPPDPRLVRLVEEAERASRTAEDESGPGD
jgi:tetratricopeptide (TPR) repeat protein